MAFNSWLEDEGETPWTLRTVSGRIRQKAEKWSHPETGKRFLKGKSAGLSV
ncbi:MAG: hypothetical protein AAFY31_05575 [Pseudomonadota bacterium]